MSSIGKLECGHFVEYPTFWDDLVRATEHCPVCGYMCGVVDQWREVWHSQCRSCSYHRTHGFGKQYAVAAQDLHARTAPGHRPFIAWRTTAPTEVVMQVTRPVRYDLPPDAPPPY